MQGWQQLICLLCLTLWKTAEVRASPSSRYFSEGGIRYHPAVAEYERPQEDNPPSHSQNASQLPEEANVVSAFPQHYESKRKSGAIKTTRIRRTPTGFSARGFHEEVFDRDFGHFSPVKRRPEADAAGFYGDTFSNGFGEFETMKRKMPSYGFKSVNRLDMMDPRILQRYLEGKRSPEMTKTGFHSDVFNGGFGEFHPM